MKVPLLPRRARASRCRRMPGPGPSPRAVSRQGGAAAPKHCAALMRGLEPGSRSGSITRQMQPPLTPAWLGAFDAVLLDAEEGGFPRPGEPRSEAGGHETEFRECGGCVEQGRFPQDAQEKGARWPRAKRAARISERHLSRSGNRMKREKNRTIANYENTSGPLHVPGADEPAEGLDGADAGAVIDMRLGSLPPGRRSAEADCPLPGTRAGGCGWRRRATVRTA